MMRFLSPIVAATLALAPPLAAQPSNIAALLYIAGEEAAREAAAFQESFGVAHATATQNAETALIEWVAPNGATIRANPQALMFAPEFGPAEWAWGVEAMPVSLSIVARAIRDLGAQDGFDILAAPTLDMPAEDALNFANIATLFDGIDGIVVLPSPTPGAVVIFGHDTPQLVAPN